MDVKTFLRKLRTEYTELELLLLKNNNIILIHALRYDRDKVQASVNFALEEQAIKNNGMLLAIDKKLKDFQERQEKAFSMISELDNELQRTTLIMYYLSRKKEGHNELTRPYSLEEVAQELQYTEGYIRHVHGDALKILRENEKALA